MSAPRRWPRWLYSAALYLLAPLVWRRVWREHAFTNSRAERLGLLPPYPAERPWLWLHCASVGEVQAARPLIEALLAENREQLGALVHCTGGGQTKVLRAGRGIHYVKDSLFPPPPLFATLQRVSGTAWREMYQVFNMGHRMEVIGRPSLLPLLEDIGRRFGIAVRQVGHCEAGDAAPPDAPNGVGNRLSIHTPGGVEQYRL